MAVIKHHKYVSALPATLEADSIYYVRSGAGYDQYVTNGSGVIVGYPANAALGLAEKVDKAEGQSLMTDAERTKLAGIEAGATANASNAQLRDRTTHTGEQSISTVTGLQEALEAKVGQSSETGAAIIPAGTDAQRPVSPQNGMERYNSDIHDFEYYINGAWLSRTTLTRALNEAPIATLASAATVNIGAASANTINISGSVTINSLGTVAAGARRTLVFQSNPVLTHNATSLILPGGANITTAAGDVAEFVSLGSGNWRCIGYRRADGTALVAPGYGQSWQDVTASRALATSYTNSSGKQIRVNVWAIGTGLNGNLTATVAGSLVMSGNQAHVAGAVACITFDVPPGATYSVNQGGTAPIAKWWELR